MGQFFAAPTCVKLTSAEPDSYKQRTARTPSGRLGLTLMLPVPRGSTDREAADQVSTVGARGLSLGGFRTWPGRWATSPAAVVPSRRAGGGLGASP